MQKQLKANIWKYFLLSLTTRRNFIPILSIYFLSLPNTLANQIGLYTGIGWMAGFLLEIPSGYLSDSVGHKNAIIIAKLAMLASTLFFVFGKSVTTFAFGASFMAMGFAFLSGTTEAFLHNTLIGLKKEKHFSEISGKIGANISLISAAVILLLPLLTKISIVMPIKLFLLVDITGIIIAISLYSPRIKYTAEDIEGENIFSQLKRFKGRGFYLMSIFLGFIGAVVMGLSPYKEPFVQSLGFPIIFIGSIMAFSRVVWFILGHNLKILKKIEINKLFLFEIIFFSIGLILCGLLKNPYLIGLIFALLLGYYFGRVKLIQEYYLDNFVINKRYKATMLSIKSQITKLFESIFVFFIGFAMTISFNLGFLISGIFLFIILILLYPFVNKSIKKNENL